MELLKVTLLVVCFCILRCKAQSCPKIKGLDDRCDYDDDNGGTKYSPHTKSECDKHEGCCWNEGDQICRPKRNRYTPLDSKSKNPFSQPDDREVKSKLTVRARNLVFGLDPRCIKPTPLPFPSGCKYTRNEPYVLDPPTDIPYCLRISCSLDKFEQGQLDRSHFKCGSTPGCYFDVELYEYREAFGPAVLAGVPVCHLAIRNAVFLREARKVQNELGSWNPYFTNCLLKTFREEIHAEAEGCGLIPLLRAFKFYPKLAGWDTITSEECRLLGACWSSTGCSYPVDINNLIVKSGQRFLFNQFDVVYGRPKCQHFNTENPYEILKSYHRCLASGCSVDISISSHYYQYLFDIGQQMSVRDHWYYWAAVVKGDIGPFNLDTDIYWPYDRSFARSLGTGDPEPTDEPSTEPPTDDSNPFAAGLFGGRKKRQIGGWGGSTACGFAFKQQGFRPCRPKPPPTLKPDTHCPYKPFVVPRFKPLKGSFYGCCEVNHCYISRRDIRKMHSGPSVYYTEWSRWSKCSVDCGRPGVQTRKRRCVSHDKSLCDLDTEETQSCGGPCNEWSEWGRWTPCPEGRVFPCPLTQRYRVCQPDPRGCEGKGPSEQSEPCDCRNIFGR